MLFMHSWNVLGGLPETCEKSGIRFVIRFFRHSQNVLGGLPVTFEKSQIRFVIQCLSCIPKKLLKMIKNYHFL